MRIDSTALQTQASHEASASRSTQTRLQAWTNGRGPATPPAQDSAATPTRISLSATVSAAMQWQSLAESAAPASSSAVAGASGSPGEDQALDPQWQLVQQLIERMTGRSLRLTVARDVAAGGGRAGAGSNPGGMLRPPGSGWGMRLSQRTQIDESERTVLQAQAVVQTADGRRLDVSLSLTMQRSTHLEMSSELRWGTAQAQDPLVINFGGTAAQLQSQRFMFDLKGDGQAEAVPLLAGNSGYLALDRNGNGRIDNGLELFGPASGEGFAELARYDQDGNGWIDEGDAVFGQLLVWTPPAQGAGTDTLRPLQQTGVGAVSLASTATPFALKDTQLQSLGAVRSTSLYLMENGQAGTVQQVDLAV